MIHPYFHRSGTAKARFALVILTSMLAQTLDEGRKLTDAALERLLPAASQRPTSIHQAMRHSVFAGGKRIRPILCMEAGRAVAGSLPTGIEDLGAALEMLHTYSLIHDDLPALDNDDLRRGRPTCHKVFGEAIAILAGDALQTQAYEVLSRLRCPTEARVKIVEEIARGTGTVNGMIGGQVVDLEAEHTRPDAPTLEYIHRSKTAALITASVVSGGIYAGASLDEVGNLRCFGQAIGLAFQIVDDVLDVTQTSEQLGIAELGKFLAQAGIKRDDVLLEEGSGLSRNNLATPNATVALLEFMARRPGAEVYLQALPVAGVDGTLRDRMKGTPAEGKVRAKTGTLRWANSLSGHVTTAGGEHLLFCIMLNRFHSIDPSRPARAEVDTLAVMLAGFPGRSDEAGR